MESKKVKGKGKNEVEKNRTEKQIKKVSKI
jgi:hypothetical protein